jgi:hypothetical protein
MIFVKGVTSSGGINSSLPKSSQPRHQGCRDRGGLANASRETPPLRAQEMKITLPIHGRGAERKRRGRSAAVARREREGAAAASAWRGSGRSSEVGGTGAGGGDGGRRTRAVRGRTGVGGELREEDDSMVLMGWVGLY